MEKLVIGICDDALAAVMQLEKIVTAYLDEEKENAQVLLFQSGEEVLERIREIDILFLDIEMPGMDGIKVGREIRKRNSNCKIIIATGYMERFKEAFKIAAFRFVTKPFLEEEIREALFAARQTRIGLEKIEVYENRMAHEVEQREICMAKAYGSYVEVVVDRKQMRKETTIKKLMEELDSRMFYQIDRKYVINMRYVSHYNNGMVTIGDNKLSVSRRRKKEFEKAYIEFDLTYGGGR